MEVTSHKLVLRNLNMVLDLARVQTVAQVGRWDVDEHV